MKQIDNRQKQLIQLRAQKGLRGHKNPFAVKGREKTGPYLPPEKPSEEKSKAAEGTPPPEGSPQKVQPKVGRNDPCPCGSGKKYKKCCLSKM